MIYDVFNMLKLGGLVGWVLLASSFAIWALVYFRYQWVCKGICYNLNRDNFFYIAKNVSQEKALDIFSEKLNLYDGTLKALVLVAPLLGLLGTVTGMIETFASLETMEMFKAGGGIAAGVSQALYTTQLGLIVSIPAMLVQRWINNNKSAVYSKLEDEVNNEI